MNVAVRGVVPDAAEFLSKARVIAVPAVSGRGLQIKTIDAIASGIPVVATRHAARGLSELPPSVAVAETARDFAAHIRQFVAEPQRERPNRAALAWSRARQQRLEGSVAEWVKELSVRAPARRTGNQAETAT